MPMNLLLRAIELSIQEIAKDQGIKNYRVTHKRNARGELVIALIVSDKDGPLSAEKVPG